MFFATRLSFTLLIIAKSANGIYVLLVTISFLTSGFLFAVVRRLNATSNTFLLNSLSCFLARKKSPCKSTVTLQSNSSLLEKLAIISASVNGCVFAVCKMPPYTFSVLSFIIISATIS